MKLIRAMFLLLAVALPTSWTIAHAEDAPPAAEKTPKKKGAGKKKKSDAKKEEAPAK